jgi:hypothetical protein
MRRSTVLKDRTDVVLIVSVLSGVSLSPDFGYVMGPHKRRRRFRRVWQDPTWMPTPTSKSRVAGGALESIAPLRNPEPHPHEYREHWAETPFGRVRCP